MLQCCLVHKAPCYSNISDFMLNTIHWLPISDHIDFKQAVLVYPALHGRVTTDGTTLGHSSHSLSPYIACFAPPIVRLFASLDNVLFLLSVEQSQWIDPLCGMHWHHSFLALSLSVFNAKAKASLFTIPLQYWECLYLQLKCSPYNQRNMTAWFYKAPTQNIV